MILNHSTDRKNKGRFEVSRSESFSTSLSSAAEMSDKSQAIARAILGGAPMPLENIPTKSDEYPIVSESESYSALVTSADGKLIKVLEESQARARAILGDEPIALSGMRHS